MKHSVCNITDKNIRDFNNTDTIYIVKKMGGYRYYYFCTFEKYERGSVYGKVISVEPNGEIFNNTVVNTIVSARLKNCYLFGRTKNDAISYDYCHWFTSSGTILDK
jgi:hypothetical protein